MNAKTLSLLLAAVLAGCGGAAADEAVEAQALPVPQAPGTRVEVATLTPSRAALELTLPGEIEGARDAVLASPAGGFIERVYVEDGAPVKAGQQLVRVNSSVYAAQHAQAKAQLEQSERELKRLEALGDLASDAQLDGQRTQVRVSKASADLAGINLSRSIIKAPFDGVVSQVGAEPGEIANPGAALVRVVQLDPVHVTVSISDRDVGSVREGMRARITAEAVPDVFTGEIIHVDPAASLQTRAFGAEIMVENPDRRLRPGMIASVSLTEELADGAVVMPQDWLVTQSDGVGVFLDEGGVARWRSVKTGAVVHDQVIIAEGLQVGDRVVITGHRGLADGDALLISREATCCESGRAVFAQQK